MNETRLLKYNTYHDNGRKKEVYYVDRIYKQTQGLYLNYNEYGKLLSKLYYKNGKLEGLCTKYHDNGQKDTEAEYKNGRREGKLKSWFYNGQISHDLEFKNDNPDKRVMIWHETGQIKFKGWYEKGKAQGEYIVWTRKGRIEKWKYIMGVKECHIRFNYKGWKVLKQIIYNKKRNILIKKVLKIRNQIYNIQGDATIYKVIMTYLTNEEIKEILQKFEKVILL